VLAGKVKEPMQIVVGHWFFVHLNESLLLDDAFQSTAGLLIVQMLPEWTDVE